jgi:hypothetical protein
MRFLVVPGFLFFLVVMSLAAPSAGQDSNQSASSSSSSSRNKKTPKATAEPGLDSGGVVGAFYRSKTLALSCKIPPGWVLRTKEMNAREEGSGSGKDSESKSSLQAPQRSTGEGNGGRVLLATFSRPPEAKGEDVNGSIVIAAEPVAAYPGLTEAVQYLGPLEEVAKAQGFLADEDPYEIAIGAKTLVREDFHRDVGTRVMHQATLVFLAKGYAVSITVIGGTDDEVEELVDGVSFTGK